LNAKFAESGARKRASLPPPPQPNPIPSDKVHPVPPCSTQMNLEEVGRRLAKPDLGIDTSVEPDTDTETDSGKVRRIFQSSGVRTGCTPPSESPLNTPWNSRTPRESHNNQDRQSTIEGVAADVRANMDVATEIPDDPGAMVGSTRPRSNTSTGPAFVPVIRPQAGSTDLPSGMDVDSEERPRQVSDPQILDEFEPDGHDELGESIEMLENMVLDGWFDQTPDDFDGSYPSPSRAH